jgi:hypothetical protein
MSSTFNPSTTVPGHPEHSQSLLSIVVAPPPITKNGTSSTIVPMCLPIGAVPPAVTELVPICCIKNCKHKESTIQLRPCAGQRYNCKKFIHSFCYGVVFIKKHDMQALVNTEENETYIACSVRCHKKALAALAAGTYPADKTTVRLAWEKDGKEGPTDINNSMNILLHWLTDNGGENYGYYRGRNSAGMTKNNYAETIARKINAAGVRCKRTTKHVLNKIAHLESTFRSAHDFANSKTGAGLMENDKEDTFKKAIEKKCTYYSELLPVFEDRASARAHITSDNLDSVEMIYSDTEEEEEEEYLPMRNVEYYVGDDATLTNSEVGETGITTVLNSVPVTVTKSKVVSSKIPTKPVSKEDTDDDDTVTSETSNKKFLKKEPTTAVKQTKSSRPITANDPAPNGKKTKIVLIDEIFHEYRIQKEEQAIQTAKEIKRHNQTMEEIAQSTAIIDSTKTNLEIGIIT